MLVVSDTSPVNYLVLIDEIALLPKIYGRIFLPQAVLEELSHTRAPAPVKNWAAHLPLWVEVRVPHLPASPDLAALGLGEREAILLAEELHADALLIDDRQGHASALKHGLRTIGTTGVLQQAAALGLIDLPSTISRLLETNFHISDQIIQDLLRKPGAPE
jgi:predicted nucleic acid-binding protein